MSIEEEFEEEWKELHIKYKYSYDKTYAKVIYCNRVQTLLSELEKEREKVKELEEKEKHWEKCHNDLIDANRYWAGKVNDIKSRLSNLQEVVRGRLIAWYGEDWEERAELGVLTPGDQELYKAPEESEGKGV